MRAFKNKIIWGAFFLLVSSALAFGYTALQKKTIDAWFAYWDVKNSLSILKDSPKDFISGVNLFFYSLDEDANIINAVADPEEYKQILSVLHQKQIKIIPTFTNDIIYSKTKTILKDPDIIKRILSDGELRKRHLEQILNIAKELNAEGVDIDYEKIYAEDRDQFSQFIKELAGLLHSQNKSLAVTVQPKTEDHRRNGPGAIDWREVAEYADQIIIMCYNYSSKVSRPGPLCPPSWLAKIMKFAKSQIPPEKICIALGLYGYDWSETDCSSVNLKKALELIKENSAQLIWDRKSQSPYFTYTKSGSQHEVWFENKESIAKKIQLIKKYSIDHIAIWHLGMLEASLSESLSSFLEQ